MNYKMLKRKNYLIKLSVSVLVLSLMMSMCVPVTMAADTKTAAAVSKRGNTMSNLNNGGTLVSDKEWLYYVNEGISEQVPGKFEYQYTVNPGIFAQRLDGTGEPRRITDGIKENFNLSKFNNQLNIVDGWIYYKTVRELKNSKSEYMGQETFICCVPSDGSAKSTILFTTGNVNKTNKKLVNFCVIDGWLYYVLNETLKDSSITNIYRMGLNGQGKMLLTNAANTSFDVEGQWLYYGDYSAIKRFKLDGTKKKETVYDSTFITDRYVVDGRWIYFYMYDSICRAPLKKNVKASEVKKLVTLSEYGFNMHFLMVYNGWIYFDDKAKSNNKDQSDMMPKMALYRVQTDGENLKTVNIDTAFWLYGLQILDGYLYQPNALNSYQPATLRLKISELK